MHGSHAADRTPAFAGGRLDRVDHVRTNPVLLAETLASPLARRVVLDGLDPVQADGRLAMEPLPSDARVDDHILLGVDGDRRPIFVQFARQAVNGFAYSESSRAIVSDVPADEVALYGAARSLVHWHARHRFCSTCGAATLPEKAGWARRCDACAAEHFPRVDPVVIMLAEHRGRVLLGRQHGWPEGRYSALAGFVEPGETIEEAVMREIAEEAGVVVRNVHYVMSQPWPFPSSLMFACIADAQDDSLTIDQAELDHAFWCDLDGVRAALAGDRHAPFIAPPPMAVASHLLHHWVERQLVPACPSA